MERLFLCFGKKCTRIEILDDLGFFESEFFNDVYLYRRYSM